MQGWNCLADLPLIRIAYYLSATPDGPRGIQAMLAACSNWNRVLQHEAFRGKRREATLVRTALATGYFLKAHLDYPGVLLQLEYSGNLRRAFRFHHCPRLTCTALDDQRESDERHPGQASLVVVRPGETQRRDRVRLLSIVSRGVSVMNALGNRVQTRFDDDGNAWFTLNKKVLRVHNNSKFRAGKCRYVRFLDRNVSLTQRFNNIV